nr:T9SS type A sorting domain-containing protein [Ignavibacteria bacterium]
GNYYQFTVNTSGFSGISISFDNIASSNGPSRVGVLWSSNGVVYNTASTSSVSTGNNSFVNSGQFSLPPGSDNSGSVTIRIYAYSGNASDRAGRNSFSESGTFSIDNLTVYASSLVTNAGSKTLIDENSFYIGITSGLTGDLIQQKSFTVNNGASAILTSDVLMGNGNTWRVRSGGSLSFGNNSILETGSSAFFLDSTGTLEIGSPSGIVASGFSGNVQTASRNFSKYGNYIYNGTDIQFTGSALPDSVNNLTINNSSGVSLSSSTHISGTLTLTDGVFSVGANTLSIVRAIQGTRTNLSTSTLSNLSIGGTGNGIVIPLTVAELHNLTVTNFQSAGVLIQGDITINNGTANISGFIKLSNSILRGINNSTLSGNGVISFRGEMNSQISGFTNNSFIGADGGTYSFVGSSAQTIPSGTYSNLQAVNAEGINLEGEVIVTGVMTLNGTVNMGSASLTIRNPFTGTLANLIGTSNSNLIITGSASNIHIPASLSELHNLQIDNNQIITADGDIKINGTLTLGENAGFLNMGNNTLEIGTSSSSLGNISRQGGSIRGKLKRWFAPSVVSNVIFPLDNGSGTSSEVSISFSSAPAGGTLTAAFHSSGAGVLPIGPNGVDRYFDATAVMGVNLINIAPIYWSLDAGDGLSGGVYNLDLIGDGLNVGLNSVGNYRYISVIKRTDQDNPWTWSGSNHSPTTGTNINPVLHYTGGTSFSDFGIAGNIDNSLLPVELISFSSYVNQANVTLSWSTSFENNNAGFDIERKTSVESWSKIGSIQGKGNVNSISTYLYEDRNLQSGKYHYRLKQIDFNGNFNYYELTNEVIIGIPAKYSLSQNFPNPFNPSTTINYEIPNSNFVSLKIYDIMGREVAILINQFQQPGFYNINFNASKLPGGIYFYKIQAGNFSAVKKLLLLK